MALLASQLGPAQLDLVARLGVTVAHRRLAPSSSARTSTTERALPSSAVQVRCWSRYRLGYVRGPEGIVVGLAEQLS
jgi:hypothetical protein